VFRPLSHRLIVWSQTRLGEPRISQGSSILVLQLHVGAPRLVVLWPYHMRGSPSLVFREVPRTSPFHCRCWCPRHMRVRHLKCEVRRTLPFKCWRLGLRCIVSLSGNIRGSLSLVFREDPQSSFFNCMHWCPILWSHGLITCKARRASYFPGCLILTI
jgi:hypothetical protein